MQVIPNDETVDTEELCATIETKFEVFKDEIVYYKSTSDYKHWFNAIKAIRDIANLIDKLELEMEQPVN
tara:strand:+ start:784 stop:990 length:207 start_codon:yes stop_codon:yes gene_type:complete